MQPRKLDDVPTGFQNIETQQVKEKKGTTAETENYQTTASGTTELEETTTLNTLEATEQSVTTETTTSEDTTELNDDHTDENNPGIIKLKDVLKNYNNFKNEIISKKLSRADKDEGVLKPIKPSILRRRTSPAPTILRGGQVICEL